jgi:hypothetical protein
MSTTTANLQLKKPAMSDQIRTTITDIANNLDIIDSSLAEKATQTDLINTVYPKADKAYVDTNIVTVNSRVDGIDRGYGGTYATLADLQVAIPTGDAKRYVVSADGKWYYWSVSAWTAGGVFQSTGISDNTVTSKQILSTISKRIGYFETSFPTIANTFNRQYLKYPVRAGKKIKLILSEIGTVYGDIARDPWINIRTTLTPDSNNIKETIYLYRNANASDFTGYKEFEFTPTVDAEYIYYYGYPTTGGTVAITVSENVTQPATKTDPGGVIVGAGLSVDSKGVISRSNKFPSKVFNAYVPTHTDNTYIYRSWSPYPLKAGITYNLSFLFEFDFNTLAETSGSNFAMSIKGANANGEMTGQTFLSLTVADIQNYTKNTIYDFSITPTSDFAYLYVYLSRIKTQGNFNVYDNLDLSDILGNQKPKKDLKTNVDYIGTPQNTITPISITKLFTRKNGVSANQSLCFDGTNIYVLYDNSEIQKYDLDGNLLEDITLASGSFLHPNDAHYLNGYLWICDTIDSTTKPVVKKVDYITKSVVQTYTFESLVTWRVASAYPISDTQLHFVATEDIDIALRTKILVGTYDCTNQTVITSQEIQLEQYYVQGCAVVGNRMFITSNKAGADSYIYCINMDNYTIFEKYKIAGFGESEGLDVIYIDGVFKLLISASMKDIFTVNF